MKILKRGDYGFIILTTIFMAYAMLVIKSFEAKPIDTNVFTTLSEVTKNETINK